MYLDHFGLSETPFRITPHTEFFFTGANRGATLEALIYAIIHDEGIVKVSGEVGSGKTMLCRVLMERLPPHVVIVYLANPSLSRDDIVFAIADELELAIPDNIRVSAVVRALQNRLIELHGSGKQVVVLIDEAHAMPLQTLEEIRLLSNLETRQHKLLQLVLFGQPELDGVLARPDMRQLRERITHNFSLEPLRRDDIAQYLDFRMRTAGYRGPEVFSPNAIKLIAAASQGLTRRINILAEKSLLAAFAENGHQITPKEVDAAIRDSQYEHPRQGLYRSIIIILFGLLAAMALLAAAITTWQSDGKAPQAATAVEPAAPLPASPVPDPPATPALPASAAQPDMPPSTATAPAEAKVPDIKSDSPAFVGQVGQTTTAQLLLGPAAQTRLQETRQWIEATADDRWFIQLALTNARQLDYAQSYLATADVLLRPEQARLYVANAGQGQRIGIIYGDFTSRQAASLAIERLPADLRTNKPFPRQVLWLK